MHWHTFLGDDQRISHYISCKLGTRGRQNLNTTTIGENTVKRMFLILYKSLRNILLLPPVSPMNCYIYQIISLLTKEITLLDTPYVQDCSNILIFHSVGRLFFICLCNTQCRLSHSLISKMASLMSFYYAFVLKMYGVKTYVGCRVWRVPLVYMLYRLR